MDFILTTKKGKLQLIPISKRKIIWNPLTKQKKSKKGGKIKDG